MRGTVGSGNSINSDLNLKFETSGQSSMKLFSSALGQSLENYVIIDVVPDPSLYLYRLGTDETDALLLLENDDFEAEGDLETELSFIEADNVIPTAPAEYVILNTIQPGSYSLTASPSEKIPREALFYLIC